jgi:hypothetical protein
MTYPEQELAELVEQHLDDEVGSGFDWLGFPSDLFLEKTEVSDWPDRGFVRDVEQMLERDGQVQGVLSALTLPIRQANTTILKPKNDKGQTEWIREALFAESYEGGMETPLDTVIGQMSQACAFKRSYHEKVWRQDPDGAVRIKKLAMRPSASCQLVRDRKTGELISFKQFADWERKTPPPDWRGFVEIPKVRALVHLNNQHRDPLYGNSDLAVSTWAYTMKQKILRLWVVFLDRKAMPKTVAYGSSPSESKDNARQLASIKGAGVVGMVRPPDGNRPFDVLDDAGQGAAPFLECIRYLDSCMTQSVMAGFMDLTSSAASGKGSYALSADASGLFLASRHAQAKEIAATINCYVIAPQIAVNFGPDAAVPKLTFEKISQEQSDRALSLLTTLSSAANLQVPPDFVYLLVERCAQYLDLPDNRVEEILNRAGKEARAAAKAQGQQVPAEGSPAGNLTDAVNGALAATAGPAAPAPVA